MEERNEMKLALLRSIESLREAALLYPDDKISRIIDTSFGSVKQVNGQSPHIDLKPVTINRFLLPAILVIIILSIVFISFSDVSKDRGVVVAGASIFVFLLFFTIRHFWFNSNYQNKVTLNRVGITCNETHYAWDDILTTHLQEITYPKENHDTEIFLLIGLTSGDLKTLDISNLNFKRIFIKTLNIELLASYIEMYKKKNSR